jgi:hypothetical protein
MLEIRVYRQIYSYIGLMLEIRVYRQIYSHIGLMLEIRVYIEAAGRHGHVRSAAADVTSVLDERRSCLKCGYWVFAPPNE